MLEDNTPKPANDSLQLPKTPKPKRISRLENLRQQRKNPQGIHKLLMQAMEMQKGKEKPKTKEK